MIIFRKILPLRAWVSGVRRTGINVGFVPTMGALHEGHLALLREAKRASGLSVCSIFVNPTQFNDKKDYEKYPVKTEEDILLLEKAGVDVLFLPEVQEIYPTGVVSPHYDLGALETILEGEFRPGHFQGVCQVVDRLLQILAPDDLFMGQKDFQQCMVVARLLEQTGSPVQLHRMPTLRENDGLAMSSRNQRLDATQRTVAPTVYHVLQQMAEAYESGGRNTDITTVAKKELEKAGFKPDYVEIRDAQSLLEPADGPVVALIAAFLGDVRLIDNLPLPPHPEHLPR